MRISLAGKRIALIGGAGFIGHHLALAFSEAGAESHVIDNLQVNNLGAFTFGETTTKNRPFYIAVLNSRLDLLRTADIPVHIVDARDYHLLSRCLNDIRPDVIVHLAAVAHASRANKDPYSTFDHSARTLENALDCAHSLAEHFVYFSSSMVYGDFVDGTVTEESPCSPLGIYGALKFGGEKLVIAYNQVFNLPYTIIRPSAAYGERDVGRRVGQSFIENTLQGKDMLINGDGGDRMDFTYIGDLVDGILKVVGSEKSKNEIFNITCGNGRSLKELSNIIQGHFPNAKVTSRPRDELAPKRGTLSINKAHEILGYSPQTSLEEGYARYIGWYKSHTSEFFDS